MLDLTTIIDPIDNDYPCGRNICEDKHTNNLFIQLKDLRISAKRDERKTEDFCGNDFFSHWKQINTICITILSQSSKDLDVLCWLIEAQLRIYGFSGLAVTLEAANYLIETYWDKLHPVEYETTAERIAPIVALTGKGGLLQALWLAPIIPETPFGQLSLWHYNKSKSKEIIGAALQAGQTAMLAHLEAIARCLSHLNGLKEKLDHYCTEYAPNFSGLLGVLHEASVALHNINKANRFDVEPVIVPTNGSAPVIATNTDTMHQVAPGYQSREDALRALLSIAAYFRSTEPNSPVAPALETLVHRAKMSFSELIEDLIADPAICNALLNAAGINENYQ